MKKNRKVGIWMDHASAKIIDISKAEADISNVTCDFSHEVKQESLEKSEHLMHQKEQQVQAAYYKRLGTVIADFEEVLLFGPTNAKLELLNTLRSVK